LFLTDHSRSEQVITLECSKPHQLQLGFLVLIAIKIQDLIPQQWAHFQNHILMLNRVRSLARFGFKTGWMQVHSYEYVSHGVGVQRQALHQNLASTSGDFGALLLVTGHGTAERIWCCNCKAESL
jgi:hypothetical protein